MSQTVSDDAVLRATGKPLAIWIAWLDERGASDLSHKEIAILLNREEGVSGWWAQNLTVSYEQHIGRRVPGQDCDGEFSVAVSKTLKGTMDDALARWIDLVGDRTEFSDIAMTRGPETSKTEKWRYWRAGLGDGSRVNVNIYQKAPGKASLGIEHEKLESSDQVEHWRSYWKQFMKDAMTAPEQRSS